MNEMVMVLENAMAAKLGSGYEVKAETIQKNNGTVKTALKVSETGASFGKVVYIDDVLEGIQRNVYTLDEGVRILEKTVRDSEKEGNPIGKVSKELILNNVAMTVVNAEMNRGCNGINRDFLDLKIMYRVFVPVDGQMGSFVVTQQILDNFGITRKELEEHAEANTRRKAVAMTMGRMLQEMMGGEFEEPAPMFVLTNEDRMYGASVLAIPDKFYDVSMAVGGDLYVIPSSIHGCLAIPAEGADPSGIRMMIQEVNETQVAKEEQLSGNVYYYSREKNELSIA